MNKAKFMGRTTDFKGKTLWEIVATTDKWGVGRMLIRNMFQRYPEPCYMRILNVQAVDSVPGEVRKVKVTVERTWRGVTLPKPITIYGTSYKADYALVPIDEEIKYLENNKKAQEQIIPTKIDFPPLLREFIRNETGEENPMMKVHFKTKFQKFARLAKDDEKPTVEISMAAKKSNSKLYEELN